LVMLVTGHNSSGGTLAQGNHYRALHLETSLSPELCKFIIYYLLVLDMIVFIYLFFEVLVMLCRLQFISWLSYLLPATDLSKSCKKWWDESKRHIWFGMVWTFGYICTILWKLVITCGIYFSI